MVVGLVLLRMDAMTNSQASTAKKIPVSAKALGKTTAKAVRDPKGRLLADAGVVVDERMLRIFKMWGVLEIEVEAAEDPACTGAPGANACEDALLAAARERLSRRMRYVSDDAGLLAELVDFAAAKLAAQTAEAGLGPESLHFPETLPAPNASGHDVSRNDPAEANALASKPVALNLDDFIRADVKFGSLPMVFNKLLEALRDDGMGVAETAEIIEKDIDLSARLLKLVNSPFYGLPWKVDTIARAVTVAGAARVATLAMGMTAAETFRDIPKEYVDMEAFWKHSLAVATAARILAGRIGLDGVERWFAAGLLHDVGRLLLFKIAPEATGAALALAHSQGRLFGPVEKEMLGLDHQEIGAKLFTSWRFPDTMIEAAACHHTWSVHSNPLEGAILAVADFLAHVLEIGSAGERLVLPAPIGAFDALGLGPSDVRALADQVSWRAGGVVGYFLKG